MRPLLQIPGRRFAVGSVFSSDGTMGKRSRFAKMIVLAKSLIVLLVSLDMAVVPVSAYARQFGDGSAPGPTQEVGRSENAGTFPGVKAFVNARVRVRDAIAIAEARAAGAKVIDINFEESDRIAYRVKTYRQNEIWAGTIDASSGEIIGAGAVTPVANLQKKEKVELASLEASGMNLSEAIAIAEQYGIGSAISAGLEERNGKLIFVVAVATDDDTLNEVMVEVVRSRHVKERTSRRPAGQHFRQ
jgi:uncharacterized membrane protein YkoI